MASVIASFSKEEHADVLYHYRKCDDDDVTAGREYLARFPDYRERDISVLNRVNRRIRETGSSDKYKLFTWLQIGFECCNEKFGLRPFE